MDPNIETTGGTPVPAQSSRRLTHLDLVRGLAAVAVCLWHLRCFGLANYADLKAKPAGTGILYFLSGLGHQAVVVFFGLSGFFIGGSVVGAWRRNQWSWRTYATHRLTRLWVVLIPALVLTLLFDCAGRALSHGSGYDGGWSALYPSGPGGAHPLDLSLVTFLGNCVFLQTVAVPVFGTNGPLWSLANEFWYYVVFPLLWFGVVSRGCKRPVFLMLAAAILWLLPRSMLSGFLVWLFGVAAYLAWTSLRSSPLRRAWCSPYCTLFFAVVFLATLLCARLQNHFGTDYWVGGAFALLVPGLAEWKPTGKLYTSIAHQLSDVSYTLYLTHFPFLAFIYFVFLAPAKQQMSLRGLAICGLCLAAVLVYSKLIWWCFERNTTKVRHLIEERFV